MLIYIMTIFCMTVYISIMGYQQYLYLAYLTYKLSTIKPLDNYERQVLWPRKLYNVLKFYRNSFLFLGVEYTLTFALFCFAKPFEVMQNLNIQKGLYTNFYACWIIIFLAITLVFLVVSIFEHKWMKKIYNNL